MWRIQLTAPSDGGDVWNVTIRVGTGRTARELVNQDILYLSAALKFVEARTTEYIRGGV